MEIIRKIEINYFRSIYSATLSHCSDLNVVVGENDAGKSNFLKALNLFFNNETELGSPFGFYDDLSRIREREAKSAKGRATIWIKITFNNYENWSSLPKTFVIKKSWSRYSDLPELTYPGNTDIPNTTLGRFLNKVSFHYIPAVRGRGIFTHYLNLLHDSLIEDERAGISEASSGLMSKINQSTKAMSSRIADRLGFDSAIGAPRDLRQLFTALDFQTKFAGYDVPLQRRGDGIQARHIPFILDFIASRSRKNHIWAYEEPENSLEMGRAFDLAEQFREDFCGSNQVFITTHSPAFYDLSGERVSKWIVKSDVHPALKEPTSIAEVLQESEVSDKVVGVAALISKRARELFERAEDLKANNTALLRRLKDSELPQIIVEGPSDKIVLEAACRLAGYRRPWCDFVEAGNADRLVSFIAALDGFHSDYGRPVVGLLDRDVAGLRAMHKYSSRHLVDGTDIRIVNQPRKIYCMTLPEPPHVTKAREMLKSAGVNDSLPVTVESMIDPRLVEEAIEADVLELREIKTRAKSENFDLFFNITEQLQAALPDDLKYLTYQVSDHSKVRFAKWVDGNAGKGDVKSLIGTLEQIKAIVAG